MTLSTNKSFNEPADGTTGWGTILNSNFTIVDNSLGSSTTIAGSTGGSTTLTAAQYQCFRLNVSGTWTGTHTLVIPAGVSGFWVVSNNNTSTGTVTVNSNGSGAQIVNKSKNAFLFCTGTAVFFLTSPSAVATSDGGTGLTTFTAANNALYSTSASVLTAGTLPYQAGGTGISTTPTNGQIDIGNGSGFTRTTLTAGTGVSITNGAGSISIAAAGNILNYQSFTASGTWTAPAGIQATDIVTGYIWGGGGGGGGATGSGGGGGGACVQFWFSYSDLTSSIGIAIGAGGAAKAAGNPSTFGTVAVNGSVYVTAYGGYGSTTNGGGGGGTFSASTGNPGGGPLGGLSGNDSTYGGGGGGGAGGTAGGNSIWGGGGGGGFSTTTASFAGGQSLWGGGGGAGYSTTGGYAAGGNSVFGGNGGSGTVGVAPGGGGSASATTGFAGARGECRVWVIRTTTA